MTISHVHCPVRDLPAAVLWFKRMCEVSPTFDNAQLAVFPFGEFTLILDAAPTDGVMTIGFQSDDCDADFAAMTARGARALESPQDRPYGARVAYFQGPGALKVELEQLLPSRG